MKLSVDILNCTRPREEKKRLCLEFRDAMLNYEPNVERIFNLKAKSHYEYSQAYMRGLRAIRPLITQCESEKYIIVTEFDND